jgi:hypothetical protein
MQFSTCIVIIIQQHIFWSKSIIFIVSLYLHNQPNVSLGTVNFVKNIFFAYQKETKNILSLVLLH